MSLLLPPVTMSRILLIHEMDLIFDNRISVSESLPSCERLDALLVCSAHSEWCPFDTYRRPRWPRTSPCRLSICWLVYSLSLSLSVGKCSFSPRSPPHRPMAGSWFSAPDLRSRPEFRSGRRRCVRFVVVCSTLSRRGNRSSPPGLQHRSPSEVSLPAL